MVLIVRLKKNPMTKTVKKWLEIAEQKLAQNSSEHLLKTSMDLNSSLTMSGEIRNIFQNHYANTSTGEVGLQDLIIKILTTKNCINPSGIENGELRNIGIAQSLTTEEISKQVKILFTAGSTRYPANGSINTYLGTHMLKKGIVKKIQLLGHEDRTRTSPRPRCKWYLSREYINNLL